MRLLSPFLLPATVPCASTFCCPSVVHAPCINRNSVSRQGGRGPRSHSTFPVTKAAHSRHVTWRDRRTKYCSMRGVVSCRCAAALLLCPPRPRLLVGRSCAAASRTPRLLPKPLQLPRRPPAGVHPTRMPGAALHENAAAACGPPLCPALPPPVLPLLPLWPCAWPCVWPWPCAPPFVLPCPCPPLPLPPPLGGRRAGVCCPPPFTPPRRRS